MSYILAENCRGFFAQVFAAINCILQIANCVRMHQKMKLARLDKLDRMISVLQKSSGTLVFSYYCQKNYKL